jgi:hypothetical protein
MDYHLKTISGIVRLTITTAVVGVLMASCLDDNTAPVEPPSGAYVSVYHASPDAPGLDVFVGDRMINSESIDYKEHSGYLNFFTGDQNFKFKIFNTSNTLIDTIFNLKNGKTYSVFVIDSLAHLETLLVSDSAATPTEGKAMVRFVNLSPDSPALGVKINGSANPLFGAQPFKQVTEFKEVAAQTVSFSVSGGDHELTSNEVQLLPGRFYTIFVRGFAQPPASNQNFLNVEVEIM